MRSRHVNPTQNKAYQEYFMQQIKGIIKIKIHQEKRNNDNKTNKQTNRKQTVEAFRPSLKKKRNVFSMQVELRSF